MWFQNVVEELAYKPEGQERVFDAEVVHHTVIKDGQNDLSWELVHGASTVRCRGLRAAPTGRKDTSQAAYESTITSWKRKQMQK